MSTIAFSLALLPACTEQRKAPLDLATPAGMAVTCAALPQQPRQLRNHGQRIAYAVCRDIALVKHVTAFLKQAEKNHWGRGMDENKLSGIVRAELTHLRIEVALSRRALEQAADGRDPDLILIPSNWQVDLDGDGRVHVWEQYFFAIPRPDGPGMHFRLPSNEPEYYAKQYQLGARIRTDATDVLWALSYHYFVEGLLESVLAYTLNNEDGRTGIPLIDPQALLRARDLIVKGLRTSERMRLAVQAEPDDQDEWLANTGQVHTVSPVRLDLEDFAVWGQLLNHLIPVFEGKTLLADTGGRRGLLDHFAGQCRQGTGVDVTLLYAHPPKNLDHRMAVDPNLICRPIDATHPASGLMAFLAEYESRATADDGAGLEIAKNLLWVN